MARGISLHVGINSVSVAAFRARTLLGPERDAEAMREIALSRGFAPEDARLLLGEDANFQNVTDEIRRAAGLLKSGDTFLFTFAGHGSRIPDSERLQSEEPDRKDEALVLFDRLLLDDYVSRVLWPTFVPGVRIIGVNDSCHSSSALFALPDLSVTFEEQQTIIESGDVSVVSTVTTVTTVERAGYSAAGGTAGADRRPPVDSPEAEEDPAVVELDGPPTRDLSPEARREHREVNFRSFYTNLQIPSVAPPINAQRVLLAACEDGETTFDGDPHGAYTQALLEVWDGGNFVGDYITFQQRIGDLLPNRVPDPIIDPDPGFGGSSPFSL